MRTLTALYESVLGAHSPPSLPKSPKPYLLCPDTSSKKQISLSEVRSRNRSAVSHRYLRYFCINMYPEWFGNFLQAAPAISRGIDFSRKSYKATSATDFLHSLYHDDASNTSQGMLQLGNDSCIARNRSFIRLMMFVLLFGFFTNSGSQQAIAGSDFAGGMQSDSFLGDFGDISTGFASAFLLIFFSELGDKTFFIAALLAARNSAAVVFTGTFGALSAMTLISVFLGRTFHYVDEILPFRFGETDVPIDDIAAACLLVYFGVSTLFEATSSDGLKAEDEQKEAELAVSEISENGTGILAATKTVISTFLLVFVAEWGDKSFFSTIALAAAASPPGVIGGALAGHGAATLLAVLGGSLLGIFLSEKVIAYVGGILFLVFAAVTLVEIIN